MSYAVHKLLLMHILVAYFPLFFLFLFFYFIFIFFPQHVQVCELLTEAKSLLPTHPIISTAVPLDYKLFISCPKAI